MGSIGPQEILVVLVIALLVVGPQRLPELARSIGKGLSEFRKVQEEVKGMVKLDLDDKPGPPKAGTPTAPGAHRTPRPAPTSSASAVETPAASGDAATETDGGLMASDEGTASQPESQPEDPSEADPTPAE